jgi:hypothetical protein
MRFERPSKSGTDRPAHSRPTHSRPSGSRRRTSGALGQRPRCKPSRRSVGVGRRATWCPTRRLAGRRSSRSPVPPRGCLVGRLSPRSPRRRLLPHGASRSPTNNSPPYPSAATPSTATGTTPSHRHHKQQPRDLLAGPYGNPDARRCGRRRLTRHTGFPPVASNDFMTIGQLPRE